MNSVLKLYCASGAPGSPAPARPAILHALGWHQHVLGAWFTLAPAWAQGPTTNGRAAESARHKAALSCMNLDRPF